MSNAILVSAFVLALCASALPSHAHHSFAAEFDADKPLKMTGTVTKVEWQNPHIVVLHRREGRRRQRNELGIRAREPELPHARRWTPSTMKAGDGVTVEGFHAQERPQHRQRTRGHADGDGQERCSRARAALESSHETLTLCVILARQLGRAHGARAMGKGTNQRRSFASDGTANLRRALARRRAAASRTCRACGCPMPSRCRKGSG